MMMMVMLMLTMMKMAVMVMVMLKWTEAKDTHRMILIERYSFKERHVNFVLAMAT